MTAPPSASEPAGEGASGSTRQERQLPPQATLGLLNYITAHSLDEDYIHVAERRAAQGKPAPRPLDRLHPRAVLTMVLFGLLLTTAAIQTARTAPTRESSRTALIAQVQDRREALTAARAEAEALRTSLDTLQQDYLNATEAGRATSAQLDRLGVAAGTAAAMGPGLRITVDDNPDATSDKEVVLDTDLQRLVNGLWVAGAEAVSINGQRLTAVSAIRTAGEAITVNYRSLSRPYVVTAIGDPEQLPARFIESAGGSWWLNLRSVYQLKFTLTPEDEVTVPAATVELRHAAAPGSEQ